MVFFLPILAIASSNYFIFSPTLPPPSFLPPMSSNLSLPSLHIYLTILCTSSKLFPPTVPFFFFVSSILPRCCLPYLQTSLFPFPPIFRSLYFVHLLSVPLFHLFPFFSLFLFPTTCLLTSLYPLPPIFRSLYYVPLLTVPFSLLPIFPSPYLLSPLY